YTTDIATIRRTLVELDHLKHITLKSGHSPIWRRKWVEISTRLNALIYEHQY
ncbi:hypothetical protein L0F63_006843, partial [Massospora cicadina]